MPVLIHVLDASGRLRNLRKQLLASARIVLRRAQKKIPLGSADIVFRAARPNNPDLKRIGGIGGYCPSAEYIQIDIDPTARRQANGLDRDIRRTLAHELHHAARYGSQHFGSTFLDALVAEGLADLFVGELFGFLPEWAPHLGRQEISRLYVKAKREFAAKDFSYGDWFIHGSKQRVIPRWAGYALGRYLVQNFLDRHPGETASSSYAKSARNFLDGSKP